MRIGEFEIGKQHPLIVAELCSNVIPHLQRGETISELVEKVHAAGAGAAKIQLYTASHFPPKEQEQKRATEFQRERVHEFVEVCHSLGMAAGASVFDPSAISLCVTVGMDYLKLATREFKNNVLLQGCLDTGLPLMRSVTISTAVSQIHERVIYLLCDPHYPSVLPTVVRPPTRFGRWGWSSHTSNSLDCIVAAALGATVIEKHIAFDLADYESGWSLSLPDFGRMCESIFDVTVMTRGVPG